jgi:basic membrane protein A
MGCSRQSQVKQEPEKVTEPAKVEQPQPTTQPELAPVIESKPVEPSKPVTVTPTEAKPIVTVPSVPAARKPIAEKLKTAFIYIGPVGDAGWSWAHDQGRQKMLKECEDIVEKADFVEFVPDGDKALPMIEKYAKDEYHLIFTTSFGHMEPTLELAKKYPHIVFMHCSGDKTHVNMGNYFGRIHQGDYLCGLVAGKMTRNNKIGYVAPHPIPEVIRGINAFTIGVRQVNPQATVHVKWTHTWYDPEKERTCAESLISSQGVDIMAQGQDSPTALLCAQEHGIMGTGYNSDMSRFAPESHLVSSIWDWSKIYIPIVKAVKDGTWKSEAIWWGMDKGLVDIAPLSERVPEDVKKLIAEQKTAIIEGTFDVFQGPIKNQKGELVLKEGSKWSDHEAWEIAYFIAGVEGDIPPALGLATAEQPRKLDSIKAGFVYITNIGDAGWTKAHDECRQVLAKLPYVTGTEYVENVADSDKKATTTAIETLIGKGCNLIFTTSWGFLEPTLEMAKKYPEIVFMHCSGYKTNPNMGTYFGRMYQARYLSGLVAGKMTRNNKLGYLIPFPIPECIRGLNAFTMGVRKVNPNATVHAAWTSTWYDPERERAVATALVEEEGVDVLAQHQDSPSAVLVAQEHDIYAVGYDSDMSQIAPKAHLTSPIWHWGKICTAVAEQLHAGVWKSEQIWWGLDKGAISLSPIGDMVPEEVKNLVEKEEQEIIVGTQKIFVGPLKDQDGNVRCKEGEVMNDQQLLSFDFFVEGVVGKIPNKEEK